MNAKNLNSNIKISIFYILFSITSNSTFSQSFQKNISGTVVDSANNILSEVIVIGTFLQKQYITSTDSDGKYNLVLKNLTNSQNDILLKLEFKLIGFMQKLDSILINKAEYFEMSKTILKSNITLLSEIIIQNKAILKKGDTTIFNVGSFKNKLDINLEDVLKKMPGMDVDETGNIRYNNKPIENIMIEGDVLSKNYKLISKNINPDMIDKVEIIDKYSSNPALKNITNSQKQTMNLVLKNPKKLRKFGNTKLGLGIKDKVVLGGNMFIVNAKLKSMVIGNHNNIGSSPFSDFSIDENFGKAKEYEFNPTIIPNFITENQLFYQSVFKNNSNNLFNNSNLAVFNNSYRINKSIVVKLFNDLYVDKINQYQQNIIKNNLFTALSYNENIQRNFKPLHYNSNLELKYNNAKSQLLLTGTFNYKNYSEKNILYTLNNFNYNIASKYKRKGIGIFYTHRMDSNRAYEISIQYTKDNKKQNLNIYQSNYRYLDSIYYTNYQNQETNNDIKNIVTEFKYFFKKRTLNQFNFKSIYYNSNFNSNLFINDSANNLFSLPNYKNSLKVINNDLSVNYNTNFNFSKFSFIIDAGILMNRNNLNAKIENKFFPIPKFKTSYKINSIQQLSFNIGLEADYPSLSNTYLNPLIFSYRSINNNNFSPSSFYSLKYGVDYSYVDIDKATFFIISYSHVARLKSEIRSIKYTNDFDYIKTRFDNISQKFDNIYIKFDKFLYPLNTGLSIKHTATFFSNPLEVSGQIQSNRFLALNYLFNLRPKFSQYINNSFGIDYTLNKDLKSGLTNFQINSFTDFSTTISKKLSLGGRLNYFVNDYAVKKLNYTFSNLYFFLTLVPQKIEAKFSLINIFNTRVALSGNVNKVITRSVSTNILSRFVMAECTFKF